MSNVMSFKRFLLMTGKSFKSIRYLKTIEQITIHSFVTASDTSEKSVLEIVVPGIKGYKKGYIMKTCPCNIQRIFSDVKNKKKINRKILIFFLFLLKTQIVGTR